VIFQGRNNRGVPFDRQCLATSSAHPADESTLGAPAKRVLIEVNAGRGPRPVRCPRLAASSNAMQV
jgi:hypothetical protein